MSTRTPPPATGPADGTCIAAGYVFNADGTFNADATEALIGAETAWASRPPVPASPCPYESCHHSRHGTGGVS